jgi:hypothetical protein
MTKPTAAAELLSSPPKNPPPLHKKKPTAATDLLPPPPKNPPPL